MKTPAAPALAPGLDASTYLPDTGAAIRRPLRLLILLTLAVSVVVPHSLQLPTAALLAASAALSLLVMRGTGTISYVGICYLISAVVTLAYIMVGSARGAPTAAAYQTVAVYMVSPLLWMILWRTAMQLFPAERLMKYLMLYSALACLSVALFFFLFLNFGAGAVRFFAEEGNVSLGEGVAGATMHVYGSLIFLTAGVFSAPELIKRTPLRILLLMALAAAALTSGRSALVLAIPIGLLAGLVIRQFQGGARSGAARYVLAFLVAINVLTIGLVMFTEIDIGAVIQSTFVKISQGGGEARLDQTEALLEGVSDTLGLGAGHGIGVDVVRNYDYPWRYENVMLASLYRVGIVGSAVYAAAFFITILVALRRIVQKNWAPADTLVFAGFLAMLVAAPTNPYIESFIFQWAYVLPVVFLSERGRKAGGGSGYDPAARPA